MEYTNCKEKILDGLRKLSSKAEEIRDLIDYDDSAWDTIDAIYSAIEETIEQVENDFDVIVERDEEED